MLLIYIKLVKNNTFNIDLTLFCFWLGKVNSQAPFNSSTPFNSVRAILQCAITSLPQQPLK